MIAQTVKVIDVRFDQENKFSECQTDRALVGRQAASPEQMCSVLITSTLTQCRTLKHNTIVHSKSDLGHQAIIEPGKANGSILSHEKRIESDRASAWCQSIAMKEQS